MYNITVYFLVHTCKHFHIFRPICFSIAYENKDIGYYDVESANMLLQLVILTTAVLTVTAQRKSIDAGFSLSEVVTFLINLKFKN